MKHTYVQPALLPNLWSSPAAPAQTDVLTSGRGLVVTSLYLGYIKQPKICLPWWLHLEHNYTQGSSWSKLQTPRSKGIKEIHDPALPLPTMWEGLCHHQQGVLASGFWRILQLVLETLGKICVWRSQGMTFSSSKAVVGGERLSHTHQRHTLHQSVNASVFFKFAFSVNIFLEASDVPRDEREGFPQDFCKIFDYLLIPPF